MFVALAVILLLAWALGFGVFHVGGGLIHLLIILAVIAVIVHLLADGARCRLLNEAAGGATLRGLRLPAGPPLFRGGAS
jgi:Family of unknown function (DUF5670)